MTLIILSYGIQDIPAKIKLISLNDNLLKSLLKFLIRKITYSQRKLMIVYIKKY